MNSTDLKERTLSMAQMILRTIIGALVGLLLSIVMLGLIAIII